MKNLLLAIVVIIVALFTYGTPVAHGQGAAAAESAGSYKTYLGGQVFGTESYTLSTRADGSRRAEADVVFTGVKFKASTVYGADNRPLSFETETNGARTLAEEFTAEGVKVRAAGAAEKVVPGRPRALLENGVWHHFIFLLAQYDAKSGGRQSFEAFLPSQALAFGITLERDASPAFDLKGRRVETEHWRAETNLGLEFEIWSDAATRTPLVIRIAAQQIRVVRGGSEELAEAVAPSAPAQKAATTSPNDPFKSEEAEFRNGEQKLAGTLTIPKAGAAPFPAAVIISGSGSQDRDGSAVANLYRLIAERLSSNGFAVLRVDDRGAGRSSMPEKTTSYRDLVNDSRAAFEYLLTRREVDGKRIALVGHSEGAETASIIAAEDARVAAVVLLAGSSRPVDKVVVEQALFQLALAAPVDPSDRTRLPAISRQIAEIFEGLEASPKPSMAADDKLAWFREHAASDPLVTIKSVRVPALILNGERDTLVLPYHAVELARALADSGNKRAALRIFPNLTHLFTPSTLDPSTRGEKSGIVSAEFLQTLQTWMSETLDKQPR
jgi:pimeloyl-ACP methyl ester carboxylesterase